MNIPRMQVLTLGVRDLKISTVFYTAVFGTQRSGDHEGVAFFTLPGVWLTLYPLDKLGEDIDAKLPLPARGFSGFSIGHNVARREDVDAVFAHAQAAGARIAKAPHDTFWGGYSGYFADPDGYYWEVAWGPMFDFARDGALRFK
ncbi:MAG: VOC family protein [Stenotrophobium sp.]